MPAGRRDFASGSGSKWWRRRMPRRRCARAMSAPSRSTWRRRPAFTPWTTASSRSRSAREVREGDRVPVGRLELEVFETPGTATGTSPTSCAAGNGAISSLATRSSAVAGSCCRTSTTARSRSRPRASPSWRELDFDALLPGHAAICLDGGMRHVAIAHAAFRTCSCPRTWLGEPGSAVIVAENGLLFILRHTARAATHRSLDASSP